MILVSNEKIAEYTELGWWGTTTIWDLFQSNKEQFPESIAVVDASNRSSFMSGEPQRLTWQQLADQVDFFTRSLLENGIKKDDVIVVQLPNCIEQYIVYLACARLGVIVSPVPAQYRKHELLQILKITDAVAVMTCHRIGALERHYNPVDLFAEIISSQETSLEKIFSIDTACSDKAIDVSATKKSKITDKDRDLFDWYERKNPVTANDVFSICWTSGTESFPKGIPRSHNEWLVVVPSMTEGGGLERHCRILNPFPLVNMAGISLSFMGWLQLCATVYQHNPFDLDVFLDQIRKEKIQYTLAAPTILAKLLKNDSLLEGVDFSILKKIGSGSAPLSEWIVAGFLNRYGVQIVNHFGSNEGAGFTGSPEDIPDPGLRAKYFPRAGVVGYEWHISTTKKIKTKLVDPVTGEVITEKNKPGEMYYKGPNIFSGYYKNPEMTQRAFDSEGYYKLGDLFQIAGDNSEYYQYVGRCKDLVIRGGVNISAQELEGIISEHEAVLDVGIVGVPDEVLGEKVCACIVPKKEGMDFNEIKQFMRNEKQVAPFKIPEHILVMDALPRNPVGKLVKSTLRQYAIEHLGVSKELI